MFKKEKTFILILSIIVPFSFINIQVWNKLRPQYAQYGNIEKIIYS